MVETMIAPILWVFGIVTGLMAFQFLFPRWYSTTFNKLEASSVETKFYASQAGLAIAVQGALLFYAGFHPSIRDVVILFVGSGKLVFATYLWINLKRLPGMLVTAIIDSLAVFLFAAYLLRI